MGEIIPTKKRKIAIVHDFLLNYGGAERVVQNLHHLFPDAPIYTLLADNELVSTHFPKATVYPSQLNSSWLRSRLPLLLPWLPQAVESFDLTDYEVVISSSGAFSHGVITGPQTLHICYCHSPMRYAWDWHSEYLSEKGLVGFPRFIVETILSRLRIWDFFSAKRVDVWLANSRAVQDRIQKYYRAESTVVHPPVRTAFFNPDLITPPKQGEPYAISVSRLTPNKRLDLIIESCLQLHMPLRILGAGEDLKRLQTIAGTSNLITFTGAVSEEEKRSQLAAARCFIFAAEDDFGIAPVEALSLGIPVIAYARGGSLDTIIERKNGIFFHDPTPESLTIALQKFNTSGVDYSPETIRKHALMFSEDEFSKKITALLSHAIPS